MFAIPKVEMRKPEVLQKVDIGPGSAPGTEAVKEELSVAASESNDDSEVSRHAWESMNDAPLLRQFAPEAERGGAIGWVQQKVWDPVFAPEVIEFGKVKMTGGIVAALKRKNPFCLLHPLVFAAGW
jgi:hypothetical protein